MNKLVINNIIILLKFKNKEKKYFQNNMKNKFYKKFKTPNP